MMIAPDRLGALPWVQLCATCQDAAEQRNEQDRSSAPCRGSDESDRETVGYFRESSG